MQGQYFNPPGYPYNTTINNKSEGNYQISPFGVVLQPVSMRQLAPVNSMPSSPLLPPAPTTPSKPDHSISLTPLSCGGYIYNPSFLPAPTVVPPPPPYIITQPMETNALSTQKNYVSPEIAARQEKLEKYREKRSKRNFNRPVDQGKRERACNRSRDQLGQFASESKKEQEKMRQALEASQRESQLLKSKLSNIEQELAELRRRSEAEQAFKRDMQKQLEAQFQMNQALIQENSMLWYTVPQNEVFNTANQTNPPPFVDAFKEKIDFSTVALNYTDSPLLEAARLEDIVDFDDQRWDEMFFAGARS
jgi:hypothetical protein